MDFKTSNDTIVYDVSPRGQPTLNNSTTSDHLDQRQVATGFINLLVPPILITIGVTCNVMTILTMRTKYFRHVSTSVYLKVGAMNDVLALLISMSAHWLYVNFPEVYVRTDTSDIMCRFFNFYGAGNNDLGILLTASMTAERALVIASPFGAAKFCSVKRAWKIVFGILTFVGVKDLHFIISSDIVPAGRTDRLCDVYAERLGSAYEMFWFDIWPWIHLAYVILCGIAIVISNSVILYFVRQSHADRSTGGQTWRHLVPMLIGESVLLIVLTFPFSLHLALLAIRLKYDTSIYEDPEKASDEALIFSVTFYMLYSNKCANFFMYCVTGSRFREGLTNTLLDWLRCRRTKRLRERIASSEFVTSLSEKLETHRKHVNLSCHDKECCLDTTQEEFVSDFYCYDVTDLTEKTQPSISVYI